MIKYIKSRISVKIFLLTMGILLAVAGISYGFVAAFMPKSYSDSLNQTLAAKARQMAESLEGYSLKNALPLIEEFSSANQSRVVLLDENGEIVKEWNGYESYGSAVETGDEIALAGTAAETVVSEISEDVATTVDEGSMAEQMEQQAMGHYLVKFKENEKNYTLFVFGSTQLVNQAVKALGQIFPWMLGAVFLISLFLSYFYSRYLSKPVQTLGEASRKMADLDFSLRTEMKRTDELGVLSKSLDTMAEKLDQALTSLQKANASLKTEMEQEREQEQRRMAFFAAASHELKTPVTILKGQIEGMEQKVGVYKDRDKYLARAGEVIATLQNMVQEILMISKMEAWDFSIEKKQMDFAELIRIQLAELNEFFEQKGMKLKVFLPDRCSCMADPGMLETVVKNILVNAVRYSPEGENIGVNLFERQEKACGSKAVLEVENTGVWIPEQDLPRLFDAFYRVDSSRNRKMGGSGLGLYIVREILEQHQAEYELKNTPKGVLFRLELSLE